LKRLKKAGKKELLMYMKQRNKYRSFLTNQKKGNRREKKIENDIHGNY